MNRTDELDILDAEAVIIRLEEAGRTLLALPNTGPSTRLVQSGMEWVRDASEQYTQDRARVRPAHPSAADISRMDQSLAWIPLIPAGKYVLRRVVGARCLVNPLTGRHLYSWRRLGETVGADHKAVKRWHTQGIDLIVAILNASPVKPRSVKPGSVKTGSVKTGPVRTAPVTTAPVTTEPAIQHAAAERS